MAYSVPISQTCYANACQRPAKERVFNYRNDHMGDYCTRHARERVQSLNHSERVMNRARQDGGRDA